MEITNEEIKKSIENLNQKLEQLEDNLKILISDEDKSDVSLFG